MACGCAKTQNVKYQVTWLDGRTPAEQTYDSISEAQGAITASGAGPGQATFKAVAA